jgi:hypothetical protein
VSKVARRSALAALGLGTAGAAAYAVRRRVMARLSAWTRLPEFTATPPLLPHDPARERARIAVARGGAPGDNVDGVLAKLGGIDKLVGARDVVLIKVSAQWWNQGMTNVAAVKRMIERVLGRSGFAGEVLVFENVHFRLPGGSGLARAWTRPSDRNVDVDGWTRMGDLIPHFARLGAPVGFVGLVDGGASALSGDPWHDAGHEHGVYGGDGRGPIAAGEDRDGYEWDFADAFSLRRSLVDHARTPLTWPVMVSPTSGLIVDLRRGLYQRTPAGRQPVTDRKLTWINMTTANEHGATGFTGAVKSPMGLVDMSAGALGTDRRTRGYQSVHYFGAPNASWRMAGPLAHFTRQVRAPDLYLTVAEWMGATPAGAAWQDDQRDTRLAEASAFRTRAVVGGTDAVAIDTWCIRNLLMPLGGGARWRYDLDDERATAVKFLRYYRQVMGAGTMDEKLIDVA